MKKKLRTWREYLDEYVGCQADPITQNRPCDFGCPCDQCNNMPISFEKWRRMGIEEDSSSKRD